MRIYDTSRNEINGKTVCMARMENHEDVLVAPEGLGFQGEVRDGSVLAPLNHENACALRRLFPFTAPTRVPVSYTHLDVYKRQPSTKWPATKPVTARPSRAC